MTPTGGSAPYTYTTCTGYPQNGTASVNSSGSYTYTANAGYTGMDTVCIQVCDASSPINCNTTKIPVVVAARQPAIVTPTTPLPVNGTQPANGTVTPTGGTAPYSYSTCTGYPAHGTATVNSSGAYTYTANAGYTGPDTVCIQVCDASAPSKCNTTKIPVSVSAQQPTLNGTPTTVSATTATPVNGNAGTSLNPTGGTGPYAYNTCTGYPLHGTITNLNTSTGAYTYTSNLLYVGPDTICVQVCDASTPAKCNTSKIPVSVGGSSSIVISPKVFLGGAYDTTTSKMLDLLRTKGLIPAVQPYAAAPFNYAGTESVSPSVLLSKPVVDWVLVQLRDSTNPSIVKATKAALVLTDGSVVSAADGVSPVSFNTVGVGNYYVAIKHRNHLGVMTATALAVSSTTQIVDFSSTSTANYQLTGVTGTAYAQQTKAGVRVLWAGNANGDNAIKENGSGNDAEKMLFKVLLDPLNTLNLPNFISLNLYTPHDVNLDGKVIYQGTSSDNDVLMFSVLMHPRNTSLLASFIIYEQIP